MSLCAVVLAAGSGQRMRPLTDSVAKPLLSVNNEILLDRNLAMAQALTRRAAGGGHHHAEQIKNHLRGTDIFVSEEQAEALGTAGAIARLRDWIGDDDVLIVNGDTWHAHSFEQIVRGWDTVKPRLLVSERGAPSDFGTKRFVGVSLLPNALVRELRPVPSGLYETVWRPRQAADLEFCEAVGETFDCGTPAEFLEANLYANGGRSVVHPSAVVHGEVIESVLLEKAVVAAGDVAVRQIRDGFGHVVEAATAAASTGA